MVSLRASNRCGFTLVELIVVVALVSLLGALALPNYRNWSENAKYKEAVRRVASLLRQARSEAVTKNRESEVRFNFETDRYSLAMGNLPSGSTSFSDIIVPENGFPNGVEIQGNSDCSLTMGEVTLQFNPNGSSNTRYICIMDDVGTKKYRAGVTVANTGRVVVQRWDAGSSSWK